MPVQELNEVFTLWLGYGLRQVQDGTGGCLQPLPAHCFFSTLIIESCCYMLKPYRSGTHCEVQIGLLL